MAAIGGVEPTTFRTEGIDNIHLTSHAPSVKMIAKVVLHEYFHVQKLIQTGCYTEGRNLCEICIFAAHIYIPGWCACPAVSDAPVNDLDAIQENERIRS